MKLDELFRHLASAIISTIGEDALGEYMPEPLMCKARMFVLALGAKQAEQRRYKLREPDKLSWSKSEHSIFAMDAVIAMDVDALSRRMKACSILGGAFTTGLLRRHT